MEKTHDFTQDFVHRGAVGSCRVRVYEQMGERPVVVATQGFGPFGQPETSIKGMGASTVAMDLIEKGIVRESYRAVTMEMIEKWVKHGDLRDIRNSAPFWFVLEVLHPRHELTFLWFEQYYPTTQGTIGNIMREETSQVEVEDLIGASLHE